MMGTSTHATRFQIILERDHHHGLSVQTQVNFRAEPVGLPMLKGSARPGGVGEKRPPRGGRVGRCPALPPGVVPMSCRLLGLQRGAAQSGRRSLLTFLLLSLSAFRRASNRPEGFAHHAIATGIARPNGRPADRHRNCSTLRAAFATPDGLVHRCRPYQCKERLLPQPSCVPECPEQLTDLSFLTDRLRSAPGNTEQSPVASIQHNSPDLRVSECLGALSLQTKRSRKTRLLRDHIADPSSLIQETPQLSRP